MGLEKLASRVSKMASSVQRVAIVLLPVFFFGLAVAGFLQSQRSMPLGLGFLEDQGYANCVVAESLLKGPELVDGEKAPLSRDALYYLLLHVCGRFVTGSTVPASFLLGGLAGVLTILVGLGLAAALRLKPWPTGLALLAVALLPEFQLAAFSGTSQSLLTFLITGGVWCFLRDRDRSGSGIGAGLYLFVLPAVWIQPEALLLFPLLGLSSVLQPTKQGTRSPDVQLAEWMQSLSGGIWGVLLLSPLAVYHLHFFDVPWPRFYDAVSVWGGDIFSLDYMMESLKLSWEAGLLSHLWPGLGIVLALASAVLLWVLGRRDGREIDFLLLLFGFPLVLSAVSPWMGREGLLALIPAVQPSLLILTVGMIADGLDGFLEKIEWRPFRFFTGSLPHMLVLLITLALIFFAQAGIRDRYTEKLRSLAETRNELLGRLDHLEGLCATDQPGWIAFSGHRVLLDLRGRYSLELLRAVGADPMMSTEKWIRLTQDFAPQAWVVWSPALYADLEAADVLPAPVSLQWPACIFP